MNSPAPAQEWSEQHRITVSEVRYGECFHNLCERFYARSDFLLNLLQLAASSSVVIAAIGNDIPKWVSAWSAAVLAVVALAGMLWQPAVRAERHKVAAALFVDLSGKAWSLSTKDLLEHLAKARKDAPLGLRSLEMPAYVRACKSIGVTPTESLSRMEKVFDAIA